MKVKVLYIHHTAGWGGASISMLQLINSLSKEHYDVKVLLLKDSVVVKKLAENNINYAVADSWFYKHFYHYFTHSEADYIKYFQIFRFFKQVVLWFFSRFYFAEKELLKHNYDIAHLNSSVLTDWLAPASRYGKVLIHIREPFRKGKCDILHPFFRSQMKKYARKIVAISNDNAKRVNIPGKTEVIYNYSISPNKQPLMKSYCSKKVLYLGGASSIKGFYVLVDALRYLEKGVVVYFCGNLPSYNHRNSIKGLIKKTLKIILRRKQTLAFKKILNSPKVKVIGLTFNVSDYLNEACCLISPFTVPHFSRPIIEAYLHKKPVIGSDIEGMSEIIKNGYTGIIYPSKSPKELAAAINALSSQDRLAKEYGEAGYRFAQKKFTPDNNKLIEAIYEYLYSN